MSAFDPGRRTRQSATPDRSPPAVHLKPRSADRRLQRKIGNQALQRIRALGDERRPAAKGIEGEDEPIKTPAEKGGCGACAPRPGVGQDTPGPALDPPLEGQIQAMRGGGRPMTASERAFMEPRFGADLGAVRLHTGTDADRANASLGARAFTVGGDIFFRARELGSGQEQRRLLAHELAHTVQQGATGGKWREAEPSLRRQPAPAPPPAPVAAPPPASVAGITYRAALMDQAPAGWGVTKFDDPVIDITAFDKGATWGCVISSATEQPHQGVRLLAGVTECTAALVSGEADCGKLTTMKTSLNTVANQGTHSGFYMLAAVQAHEDLHITQYKGGVNPLFTTLKTAVEALTVPKAGSATAADAKTAIKALPAFTTAKSTFDTGEVAAANATAAHSPMAPFNTAEHGVVDPRIAEIDARKTALSCP